MIEWMRSRAMSRMTPFESATLTQWRPVAYAYRGIHPSSHMKMLDLGCSRTVCDPIFDMEKDRLLPTDE